MIREPSRAAFIDVCNNPQDGSSRPELMIGVTARPTQPHELVIGALLLAAYDGNLPRLKDYTSQYQEVEDEKGLRLETAKQTPAVVELNALQAEVAAPADAHLREEVVRLVDQMAGGRNVNLILGGDVLTMAKTVAVCEVLQTGNSLAVGFSAQQVKYATAKNNVEFGITLQAEPATIPAQTPLGQWFHTRLVEPNFLTELHQALQQLSPEELHYLLLERLALVFPRDPVIQQSVGQFRLRQEEKHRARELAEKQDQYYRRYETYIHLRRRIAELQRREANKWLWQRKVSYALPKREPLSSPPYDKIALDVERRFLEQAIALLNKQLPQEP